MFALLIISAELLLYGPYNWYSREYKKHDVQSHMIKEISHESLLAVTDEMMEYLRGRREDLVIEAERDGVMQEFFTDREKAHMEDVRGLFIAGIVASRVAIGICVSILIYLLVAGHKQKKARRSAINTVLETAAPEQLPTAKPSPFSLLAGSFIGTSVVVFVSSIAISALFASDFTKYFVKFHHIFFDNDLWILYQDKDDMINMLPEGFFSDTALAIVVIFLIFVVLLIIISIAIIRRSHPKAS